MNNPSIIHYLARHERVLHQLIQDACIPDPHIREAMVYALFPGGKRLRPLLVYLTGKLLDVNESALDIIAAAIEFTHCYSLIHDDLPSMDNDDFRRGKPSCHRAFDEATAILAGDGMQSLAIEILLQYLPHSLTPSQVIAITYELVKASGPGGMVSGQSRDLKELNNLALDEKQLTEIHRLKTGKLISACFNMVLAATDINSETAKNLQDISMHLGLVFQLQDDYLDAFAETNFLGKKRRSDVANDKVTFATLYSKAALRALIHKYYQQLAQSLRYLGPKADDLLYLIRSLHARTD